VYRSIRSAENGYQHPILLGIEKFPLSADIERFQEKWNPVFRSKTRQNKELEHFRVSMKP
jgi:hypothetical protein